jgi:FixJ family two-component response regulator
VRAAAWSVGKGAGAVVDPDVRMVTSVRWEGCFPPKIFVRRNLSSFGYSVEAFASAADFLASHRVSETACLIADVNIPELTRIELYQHLVDAGHAIPTMFVTAYPNDVDRARALNDGIVCYLRKPVDDQHLIKCLRAALASDQPPEENS